MDWLNHSFTYGLLVGLVLGVSAKWALRFLTFVAGVIAIFELLHASGAL